MHNPRETTIISVTFVRAEVKEMYSQLLVDILHGILDISCSNTHSILPAAVFAIIIVIAILALAQANQLRLIPQNGADNKKEILKRDSDGRGQGPWKTHQDEPLRAAKNVSYFKRHNYLPLYGFSCSPREPTLVNLQFRTL